MKRILQLVVPTPPHRSRLFSHSGGPVPDRVPCRPVSELPVNVTRTLPNGTSVTYLLGEEGSEQPAAVQKDPAS